MKVVPLCGGLGKHMREYSEAIPKPMVSIGYRPILWHAMKYYAGRLRAYPRDGYWACMDTFKEKQDLEDIFGRGSAPWAVWNHQYEIKK